MNESNLFDFSSTSGSLATSLRDTSDFNSTGSSFNTTGASTVLAPPAGVGMGGVPGGLSAMSVLGEAQREQKYDVELAQLGVLPIQALLKVRQGSGAQLFCLGLWLCLYRGSFLFDSINCLFTIRSHPHYSHNE